MHVYTSMPPSHSGKYCILYSTPFAWQTLYLLVTFQIAISRTLTVQWKMHIFKCGEFECLRFLLDKLGKSIVTKKETRRVFFLRAHKSSDFLEIHGADRTVKDIYWSYRIWGTVKLLNSVSSSISNIDPKRSHVIVKHLQGPFYCTLFHFIGKSTP